MEVIEFLPQVIDGLRKGLVPLSDELNAAAHLQITPGDVYERLLDEPRERFVEPINTLVGHEQTDWLFFGVR